MSGARILEQQQKHDPEQPLGTPSPPAAVFQVGPADDEYERAAEATAQRVMRALAEGTGVTDSAVTLQRDAVVQRSGAVVGAAGGDLGGNAATSIARERGRGVPLQPDLRTAMESAFGGANFGSVRVHSGGRSEVLNEQLSARAFTVGNDIFLGRRAPALDTPAGQHVLAHELAHTRQQRDIRQPAGSWDVHRLFHPVTTTEKTTLRNAPKSNARKRGKSIPAGTEIVADRGDDRIEELGVFADQEEWVPAVNVRPEEWTADDALRGTFIRASKLGNNKTYPIRDRNFTIEGRFVRPEWRWHDSVGEYLYIEDSPRGDGAEIVRKQGVECVLLSTGDLVALNRQEMHHVDVAALKQNLCDRLTKILKRAAVMNKIDPALFAKPEHIGDADDEDGSLMKALRANGLSGFESAQFARWYQWKENVIAKIVIGSMEAAESIEYWRRSLYPDRESEVEITDIEIDGSDLHDRGLGAMFVTFRKPEGPPGSMFADKTDFKTVIKPEDRNIEAAIFGTEDESLASRLNDLAGLGNGEAIAKIKMQTHARHGSLIEFVAGTMARDLGGDREHMSDAGREAMVLTYIAGLSDVHLDNVIWDGDTPYFIDADNALNSARIGLTVNQGIENQKGFTSYSDAGARDEQRKIKEDQQGSDSKIMKALLREGNPVPVVDAVRKAFAHKTGRVVPLFTQTWAINLKRGSYGSLETGVSGDAPPTQSQWAVAAGYADDLVDGSFADEPGLRGESGIADAGQTFHRDVAMDQIKSDLDQGKIPFFTYEYDTGHVSMNGQVIWHGAPLEQSLEVLLQRYPHQRGLVDNP